MSQVINTNVMSLNAQRNLSSSQTNLATSLNRLSSGLRINSAKDDAAGMAISERFTTQIRGLNQAVRNSNDGISFAQTAEGALSTVANALQRIRELAVQSSNDTNSASDRQAIQNEVKQLVSEISRVSNSTEFNGQRILDGSLDKLFFQVGANQGQMIGVEGVDSRTEALGASSLESIGLTSEQLSDLASGVGMSGKIMINVTMSGGVANADVGGANPVDTASAVGVNGAFSVNVTGVKSMEGLVRAINNQISTIAQSDTVVRDAGLVAAAIVDNNGRVSLTINAAFDAAVRVTARGDTAEGTNALFADRNGNDVNLFGTTATSSAKSTLDDIDVTTRKGAAEALATVDGALNQISGLRSELGAVQIRFESTISNLSVSVENVSAARSRIMDTDFAAETAALTRAQILQQAGVAMLAQANQMPQNVLSLLR